MKGFVLDGAEVAKGGVPAPGVVPSLDSLEHRRGELGAAGSGAPVEELTLHGRPERPRGGHPRRPRQAPVRPPAACAGLLGSMGRVVSLCTPRRATRPANRGQRGSPPSDLDRTVCPWMSSISRTKSAVATTVLARPGSAKVRPAPLALGWRGRRSLEPRSPAPPAPAGRSPTATARSCWRADQPRQRPSQPPKSRRRHRGHGDASSLGRSRSAPTPRLATKAALGGSRHRDLPSPPRVTVRSPDLPRA